MSIEDELKQLALEREEACESALNKLDLDPPGLLLRQMRAYLAEEVDRGRIKRFIDKAVQLSHQDDGTQELECPSIQFVSGSSLDFKVGVKEQRSGWRITQFKFHLHLSPTRKVSMVRVHLNGERTRDPLIVPRCHLHIGGGKRAHVPFPIMSPRLTLQFVCSVIEPDIGL